MAPQQPETHHPEVPLNLHLKRVVILARHGARTPLHDFPEMLGEVVWDPEKLFEVPHGIENVKTNILSDQEIKISSKTLDGSALTTYGHILPGIFLRSTDRWRLIYDI